MLKIGKFQHVICAVKNPTFQFKDFIFMHFLFNIKHQVILVEIVLTVTDVDPPPCKPCMSSAERENVEPRSNIAISCLRSGMTSRLDCSVAVVSPYTPVMVAS